MRLSWTLVTGRCFGQDLSKIRLWQFEEMQWCGYLVLHSFTEKFPFAALSGHYFHWRLWRNCQRMAIMKEKKSEGLGRSRSSPPSISNLELYPIPV
jgi:hypothetical protein